MKKTYIIFSVFIILSTFFLVYHKGISKDLSWQTEVQKIDKNIKNLENLRDLEISKAKRNKDQGDRLQFENNMLIDAKNFWKKAELNKEKADQYQKEIDQLQHRKQQILKNRGIELEKHSE